MEDTAPTSLMLDMDLLHTLRPRGVGRDHEF